VEFLDNIPPLQTLALGAFCHYGEEVSIDRKGTARDFCKSILQHTADFSLCILILELYCKVCRGISHTYTALYFHGVSKKEYISPRPIWKYVILDKF
jgi:hypothetical protein